MLLRTGILYYWIQLSDKDLRNLLYQNFRSINNGGNIRRYVIKHYEYKRFRLNVDNIALFITSFLIHHIRYLLSAKSGE